MTLTSDVVAGLPSSLLSSSSPLSAEALDAALEAQRSSARLVVSVSLVLSESRSTAAVARGARRASTGEKKPRLDVWRSRETCGGGRKPKQRNQKT